MQCLCLFTGSCDLNMNVETSMLEIKDVALENAELSARLKAYWRAERFDGVHFKKLVDYIVIE